MEHTGTVKRIFDARGFGFVKPKTATNGFSMRSTPDSPTCVWAIASHSPLERDDSSAGPKRDK